MLSTSARIGEVLAIRRRYIDITSATSSIRISGTIVTHRGEPTMRQDHPKTAKSRRTVAIPTFTAEAMRRRLTRLDDSSLDGLGTPLTTNNVRHQLRHTLDVAGISGVTPHMFRRTVATTINQVAGYVRSGTIDDYAKSNFMIPAAAGHDVIFENTLPIDYAGETMPAAVVAADLAVGTEMRQRWLAAR